MYRAIASDLDGTLLREGGVLSPRTLSVLTRCVANGIKVVIATGRARCSAATVLPEELNAATWVCCNGADIYENGELVAENCIAPDDAREIIGHIMDLHPGRRMYCGIGGELFSTQPFSNTGIPVAMSNDLREVVNGPVGKISFAIEPGTDVEPLRARLPDGTRLIVTLAGKLAEIMAAGATKAWGVETAVSRWGIGLNEVVAFGDETNDTEMIAECGLGVAMGNAHPEVKSIADRQTVTNDEDGVARVLESLFQE